MINQYTNSYSSASSDIQSVVSNSVGMLNKYILMQTGEYEYTALIKNVATKNVEKIVFSRSGSYNSAWSVSRSTVSDFSYNVSNEYYVFSNMHIGKSLDLPVYKGMTSFSLCIIVCLLSFAVLFKGVLFKCLKRR